MNEQIYASGWIVEAKVYHLHPRPPAMGALCGSRVHYLISMNDVKRRKLRLCKKCQRISSKGD